MKNALLLLLFTFCTHFLFAQLLNPGFEDDTGGSLEHWINPCGEAEAVNEAPADGGQWSLRLPPGNTQGCYPRQMYQAITGAVAGEAITLSCWAKSEMNLQARLSLGVFNNYDQPEVLVSDTTTSTEWIQLSLSFTPDEVQVGAGLVVILEGGITGGPAGNNIASNFDEIEVQLMTTRVNDISSKDIQLAPNPVTTGQALQFIYPDEMELANLMLFSADGHLLRCDRGRVTAINVDDLAAGVYFCQLEDLQSGRRFIGRFVKL